MSRLQRMSFIIGESPQQHGMSSLARGKKPQIIHVNKCTILDEEECKIILYMQFYNINIAYVWSYAWVLWQGPLDGQVMLEVFLTWYSRYGSWLPLQNTTSGMLTMDHNMMTWIYFFEEKVMSWLWEDYLTWWYIDVQVRGTPRDGVHEGSTFLEARRWESSSGEVIIYKVESCNEFRE